MDGQGVAESLSGLAIEDKAGGGGRESIESQESRRSKKSSTLPKNDQGSLPGRENIGIYALGLQEIVDIGSATEALRPYSDPHPAKKWKHAVEQALPTGYQLVAEQQLIGLLLLIYAAPDIAHTISSVSTTSVGTGLMGYMGNKGAVTARIVLGEATRMVFVNCHLSAGAEKGSLERRDWDASQIQSRTKFEPIYDGGGVMEEFGEGIGDEDFAFWFGDLNYRLEDMPGEDVRRLLMLHTRDEYGKPVPSKQRIEHELASPPSSTFAQNQEAANQTSEDDASSTKTAVESTSHHSIASSTTLPDADKPDPSSDPTSLQTTLASLLTHDQLHSQMRTDKAFHDGWREGPIDFLPTYKYDVGSVGMFDSSEKRRGPSWCDRILFRTRKDKTDFDERVREEEQVRKKDNELRLSGVVEEVANEAVLFDYDPAGDAADKGPRDPAPNPEIVITRSGVEDKLHLDSYISHQRVLSSDHKPLDAVFTLDYDAVEPDLKAKIHHEVARDLDKAENEGRPVVTVVVDRHRESESSNPGASSHPREGVDFGDVKYDHIRTRHITIANTGRVTAALGFVDRAITGDQPKGVCPDWLTTHFDRPSDSELPSAGALKQYTLEPGEAANVDLTIHVTDLDLVRRLNNGDETLDDVLVLRIQNGRDYFLPIHANWQQSAFGRSIEKLVRIPEGGVRRWQHQRPDGSSDGNHHEGVKWSAPRELFRLTEAIEDLIERACAEWGMMKGQEGDPPWDQKRAWPFWGWVVDARDSEILRETVREGLDTDTAFKDLFPLSAGSFQRLEAIAETLVQFLESLEDGVITEALWLQLDKGLAERESSKTKVSDEEQRLWILDILSSSPVHSIAFTFVTAMLSRVASEVAPVHITPTLKRRTTATSFNDMDAVKESEDEPSRLRRKEVDEAYAAIFANAMIRLPATLSGKARTASEKRSRHVIEVFSKARIDDGMGY